MDDQGILIVEDEKNIREVLKYNLQDLGYEVAGTCNTASEVLEILNSTSPALVLMDIVMPGDMDGIEAANKIWDEFHIPVVFVSAHDPAKFKKRIKKTTAYGFLTKPIDKDLLDLTINQVLSKSEISQELKQKEALLKLAQELSQVGSWELDLQTKKINLSDETYKIFGLPPDKEVYYSDFLSMVHPEDRNFVDEQWGIALEKGDFDIEYRIIKNDKTRWVRAKAKIPVSKQSELNMVRGSIQDITEQKRRENKIRKFNRVVEQSPSIVVITDLDGHIEFVNPRFTEVTGYDKQEILGKNPRILKSGKHSEKFYSNLWETISSGEIWRRNIKNQKKNGDYYWEEAAIAPITDDKGNITHYAKIAEDITRRKNTRENLKSLNETLIDLSTNHKKNIKRLTALCGELVGADFAMYNHFEGKYFKSWGQWQTPEELDKKFEARGTVCHDVISMDSNRVKVIGNLDKTKYAETSKAVNKFSLKEYIGSPVYVNDNPVGVLCVFYQRPVEIDEGQTTIVEIISSAIQVEEKLEIKDNQLKKLSLSDPLTGLANRRKFDKQLRNDWNRCFRSGADISLIILDIDYFKKYNDNYGHPQGDDALIKLSEILENTIKRSSDTIARYGGEEFAVILPETDRNDAQKLAENIRKDVKGAKIKHITSNCSNHLTVSAGVATKQPTAKNREERLVDLADTALYKAKNRGRNRVVVSRKNSEK